MGGKILLTIRRLLKRVDRPGGQWDGPIPTFDVVGSCLAKTDVRNRRTARTITPQAC